MKFTPLVESLDPITINQYAKAAYQTVNDVVGSSYSLGDARYKSFGQVSKNPAAIAVLNSILSQLNLEKYSSALRETKTSASDKQRSYLYLISTVIPSLAKYLYTQLNNVSGVDRAAVNIVKDVFLKNYENSKMSDRNPMSRAAKQFSMAVISAVESNVPTRKNTSVEDDVTANETFIENADKIQYRIDAAEDFVNDVLTVTGTQATEENISEAIWLLMAYYFAYDDAMTNKGIPEFTDFLGKTVEKSSSNLGKKIARIDDTGDENDGNALMGDNYVLKNVDSADDDTNQHSMITDKTSFVGRGFVKLFAANFSAGLKAQPIATDGSKDNRVTQRDVMAAMKLIINHVSPNTSVSSLTPEAVDYLTATMIADNTETALSIHEEMSRYVLAGPDDLDGSLLGDLSKDYKNPAYCDNIRKVILKIYLHVGNRNVGQYQHLPELSYSFGELSPNDRAKTAGLTSTGKNLMSLFNNDGEVVHVMNMNGKTKLALAKSGGNEVSIEEIDSIPIKDIQAKCKGYVSPALVMLPIDNYVWGFIYGIQPFTTLHGEDFEDSANVSPLVTELKTRIGNEDPLKWKKAELMSTDRIASRLYSADNRKKMVRVGFASNDSDDLYYENFAKKLYDYTKANPESGDILTKTASIAKAFTGVVNNYLRLCTAIKDDALTARKRVDVYNAAPTAESMIVQGESAIDYSVLRFLSRECKGAGADDRIEAISEQCVKPLVIAIKNAQFLQNNQGNLSVEKTGRIVKKCIDYFSMFAKWVSNNNVNGIQFSFEDKNILNNSSNTAVVARVVTNPQTVARWVGWVKTLTSSAITEKTGDPIVDQEIANRQYLIDGWNSVVQKYIKDAGYTVSDLRSAQQVCKSFSVEERPLGKFNELYTPMQLLISLRTIGGISTDEEKAFELDDTVQYDNVETGNLDPARPVSAVDAENKNARELNALETELDGSSMNAVYGNGVTGTETGSVDDALTTMAKRLDTVQNPFDKALASIANIQQLTEESDHLAELLNDMTDQDADLTDTQQSSVWRIEQRMDFVNKMKDSAQSVLMKDIEGNRGVGAMVYAMQKGTVSADEVMQARRYISTANAISGDLYNSETRHETAYTSTDEATVAHLVIVLGDEAFSTNGIDAKDAYDSLSTVRTYITNASGNPASLKAIDYAMKTVGTLASDGVKSSDAFGTLIRLINKIGRIIGTDAQSVANALSNTHGLRYDKTEDYDAVKNPTTLDNPIDAFARARLRPISMKNTGVVSDAESEERLAFSTNMFTAMKENPVLAKYAYNMGKAMSTFERSLVDEDERFSDTERANRQFNSINDSLKENNLLYGEIAQTTPQRLVYNAIFDDERAGHLNYPKTTRVVDGLANGYNLSVLSKEFKKPGERETGPDWARKRDAVTTGYSFRDDKFSRMGEGLDEGDSKDEIIASWFNPDNPKPSTDIKELVKSARQYICSKIANRIGTIDELTGEVDLKNGKTSEALKAAVKSIYELANDLETPIADVIVATTSLGQKNARAAMIEKAKEALISGDENYTVDDMGDIASELNVFPERLSNEISTVDQHWIDSVVSLVAAIPDELGIKDVMAATDMYCGSLADRRLMMERPGFKMMYAILHMLQSMKSRDGAPIGYFGDNSGDENKNLRAVVNSICRYRAKAKSWKEAAADLKEQLTKDMENGLVDRRVGEKDIPSQSARKRLAHLRMDPNYSVSHSDESHVVARNVMKALTRSKYLVPGNSSRTVVIADADLVIDLKTLYYWLNVIANQLNANDVDLENINDGEFTELSEDYMNQLVMTYITGVKPKYLAYLKKTAESSKVSEETALSADALSLAHAELIGDDLVKVGSIGILTKDAYVTAFKSAYDIAAKERGGNPSDQDIANAFVVQIGVLTGKKFNPESRAYDAETPMYDLSKPSPTPKPKADAPTIAKRPEPKPTPKPVPNKTDTADDDEEEFVPEVHGAGE